MNLGQESEVHVTKFLTEGTINPYVHSIQSEKAELAMSFEAKLCQGGKLAYDTNTFRTLASTETEDDSSSQAILQLRQTQQQVLWNIGEIFLCQNIFFLYKR